MTKTLLLASAACLAVATPATAQEAPRNTAGNGAEEPTETIIVVGETTDVAISAEQIDRIQANDLADVFRQVPSVNVGGSLGLAQKVYVRGLEDTLLNITVDGAPQTGTLFHHIGRVSIEPELLKEVEVQTGAGEATAGFGAIGGAIRFRTKDAADLLDGDKRFGLLAKAGIFSNDGEKVSLTGYGELAEGWGVIGSYVHVDRDNMEDGDGNTLYGTGAEQELGFVKLSGEIGRDQRLSLSYETRDETGEFGQRPNWPALQGDTLFPAEAERDTAIANYQYTPGGLVDLEATAYYTRSSFRQNRFDRWGLYGAEIETTGFDIRNTSRFGTHEITYGIEHRADSVMSEYLAEDAVWQYWAWDPSIGRFEEEGDVWGVYVQDHYQVTDPLLLSFGLRYDSYTLDQLTYDDETESDGVSGNAGLLYQITPSLAFSAGYAQALRGKEVGDAFTLEHRPGRISLAPDLDAERVGNAEAGLVYDNGPWRGGVSVYSMEIDDVILDQLGSGPAPQSGVYYENIGTLKTDGVEIQAGYATDIFSADLFYTTRDTELNGDPVEGYEHIGLANAAGDSWNLNFGWFPLPSLDLGYNVRHVQEIDDLEVLHRSLEIGWVDQLYTIDKPGYTVHDIYAEFRPLDDNRLKLGLAVQNLFDEQYRDHSSVGDYTAIPDYEIVAGVYEAGRDIRLSVSYDF